MTDFKYEQGIDPTTAYAPVQEYAIRDSRPNTIRFYNGAPDNTEVLRISKDGIWANPDVPTDDAAKKVLEALGGHLTQMLDKAREEGRKEMQGRVETLDEMYKMVCRQRDELMDQQRAQVEAMRGRMQ